jgi:hypothetical protein
MSNLIRDFTNSQKYPHVFHVCVGVFVRVCVCTCIYIHIPIYTYSVKDADFFFFEIICQAALGSKFTHTRLSIECVL